MPTSKQNGWRRKRAVILARDNYQCQYCDCPLTPTTAHLDHVLPVCQGGTSRQDNLVAACQKCQLAKDNLTVYQMGLPDWRLIRLHPTYLANKRAMMDLTSVFDAVRQGRYATGAHMVPMTKEKRQ